MSAPNHVYGLTSDGIPRDALDAGDVIDRDDMPTGTPITECPDCDECANPVTDDDAAPSCGAHYLHIVCQQWFRCRECEQVWREVDE